MLLNVKKCCFAPAASRLNKKTARWRLGAIVPGEHPYRRVGGEERAGAQPRRRSAASLGWPRERVSCVNSPGMSGTLPSAWVRTAGRGLRDIFRTGRWRDDLRPWHYALALRTGAGPQARRPTQRRSLQGLGAAHPSRQSQLPQRAERADVLICLGDLQVPRSLVHSGPRLRMLDEDHFRSLGKLIVRNLDRIADVDNIRN
jgi:hypothetical protein